MTWEKQSNKGLERYLETAAEQATWKSLTDTCGDYAKMAEQLGISQSGVRTRLQRMRAKAARRGWLPGQDDPSTVPDGYHVKGTSTLYSRDEAGDLQISAQWVKTNKDREDRVEAMRIACEELAEPLRGCIAPVDAPLPRDDDDDELMATYLIGDHHLGMYAWAEETGSDYDCEIAERLLRRAFERLGDAAPRARKGLIVSIGDFYHADNHSSMTPASGHILDTDSRHSRVIQTGIRMLKRAIEFALTKHQEVEVRIIAGNHDPESSLWLAHCMAVAYENETRVTVSPSPRTYQFVKWGQCLIGTTHGDKCKPAALGEVMAVDCREAWGSAKFCHWYTGHVHHKWTQELRGCVVESLSVLAGTDAWHAGKGYRSQRGMQLDVWHKRHGRVTTIHGTVEYIEDDRD